MNSLQTNLDLSTALEMAVRRSWEGLQKTHSSALIQVEYRCDTAGALKLVKLWSSGLARGEWDLLSEYSVSHTAFHPVALAFIAGREVSSFSTALAGIVQHANVFRARFQTTAPQLVLVRAPNAAEGAEAAAAMWTDLMPTVSPPVASTHGE